MHSGALTVLGGNIATAEVQEPIRF
jgi:hypothetical protein